MQKISVYCPAIARQYQGTMAAEAKLSDHEWQLISAKEMWQISLQIFEYAKAATILRSYNREYGLTRELTALESDGAHSNLMAAMVDRALAHRYGFDVHYTEDGYTYREVMEAIRRHDLPENDTGDIPDNGQRDEAAKTRQEAAFQAEFSQLSPHREAIVERRIKCLLAEMDGKTSPTGKLLYTADKVAAIIMTLCYDALGNSPGRFLGDTNITERDRREIDICDSTFYGAYRASEMWTIDFFRMRKLVRYDETGFFTSLIVMLTLQVHGSWYRWREADYRAISS